MAWTGWALLIMLLLALAVGWLLWPLVPPRQSIQPDSPEAWRALMQHPSHPVHLAAAILLAGSGDAEGTRVFLEAFPTLTKDEEHVALQALLGLTGKENLAPALIEAFLNHPESYHTGDPDAVLELIPPGLEARHNGRPGDPPLQPLPCRFRNPAHSV